MRFAALTSRLSMMDGCGGSMQGQAAFHQGLLNIGNCGLVRSSSTRILFGIVSIGMSCRLSTVGLLYLIAGQAAGKLGAAVHMGHVGYCMERQNNHLNGCVCRMLLGGIVSRFCQYCHSRLGYYAQRGNL